MTNLVAAFLFLGTASFVLAEDPQPGPQFPEDALTTRELIAWSWVQKPQPAPEPLPPRDTPIPQPDQPQDQRVKPPGDPQDEQSPAAQSFTGKIVKDTGKYVLKTADNSTYQLDGQDGLGQYENQNVKVVGKLEAASNTIHIVKIDLIS